MFLGHGLIARTAVAKIVTLDDAGILEQLHRSVDGGNRDARIHGGGAAVKLLDIGMVG